MGPGESSCIEAEREEARDDIERKELEEERDVLEPGHNPTTGASCFKADHCCKAQHTDSEENSLSSMGDDWVNLSHSSHPLVLSNDWVLVMQCADSNWRRLCVYVFFLFSWLSCLFFLFFFHVYQNINYCGLYIFKIVLQYLEWQVLSRWAIFFLISFIYIFLYIFLLFFWCVSIPSHAILLPGYCLYWVIEIKSYSLSYVVCFTILLYTSLPPLSPISPHGPFMQTIMSLLTILLDVCAAHLIHLPAS